MVEFKEGRWFLGIWFLAYDGWDSMMSVHTDDYHPGSCEWEMDYRTRYYDPDDPDNDPFSGKDKKSGYRLSRKGTEEEVVASVETVIGKLTEFNEPIKKFFCPLYSSNPLECLELLKKQPWVHMKEVSKEEYEAQKGGSAHDGGGKA